MKQHTGAPVKSQEVIVNGNGTLKNTFVWVKSGLPDKTWKLPASTPVELDQKACLYEPHVLGSQWPSRRSIRMSSDPANPNIHPRPLNGQCRTSTSRRAAGSSAQDAVTTPARRVTESPSSATSIPWMRAVHRRGFAIPSSP